MAKYKNIKYKSGNLHGGSNINFKLIKCDDKVDIPLILLSSVLNWYHTYFLHPGMDITEAIIRQFFY